jgi:aspartyl-tRNA(Asn)/glutamyl-tRNA(Gln) amidotransferase subunit A
MAARAQRLDPLLGTFLTTFTEQALLTAKEQDEAVARGENTGPLTGVTVAVKDIIATDECPTTCQSRVYDASWWQGRDALVVRRLREAGALIVGKTTMTEHAMARPDPHGDGPLPRNPWDVNRWTGGSSCGSANGVAADLFDIGIGTDSNGSIRIPAALCGVTGFKPTHGLVPTAGCLPTARSLDAIGPLARSVRDCARVLAVMAGEDSDLAAAVRAHAEPTVPWSDGLAGTRIGVPYQALAESGELPESCRPAFDAMTSCLTELGAEIVEIDLPEGWPLFAAGFVTLLAEAFDAHRAGLAARWSDYGAPFRRGVAVGGLIDAGTYLHAQRTRGWAVRSLRDRLAHLDGVLTPMWPGAAPRYDDAAGYHAMSGVPGLWSAAGFPAIAFPMGFDAAGLPLSAQLAGWPWQEATLVGIVDAYQRRTDWHTRRPCIPDGLSAAELATPPVPTDPSGEAADSGARSAVTALLGRLGVRDHVADGEIAALAAAWTAIAPITGALPPVDVDAAPLLSVDFR